MEFGLASTVRTVMKTHIFKPTHVVSITIHSGVTKELTYY